MTPLLSPLVPGPSGPFDAAVIIPTVIRPSLERAVRSVFAQRFAGTIQILLGVDARLGDPAVPDRVVADAPVNCGIWLCDPGYSTAARNGGGYPAGTGGSLRTLLSYAAHSRRVAYLDDDNWWGPDHLSSLADALAGHDWAWSLRWFAEPDTGRPLGVDRWESVGPGKGFYAARFGGFADPSCLMVDAAACEPMFRLWCRPLPGDATGMSTDRPVFDWLKLRRGGATRRATAFYTINPSDPMHAQRIKWMAAVGEPMLPPETSDVTPSPKSEAKTAGAMGPAISDDLAADLVVAGEFWSLASRFAHLEGLTDPREGYLIYRLAGQTGAGTVVGIGNRDARAGAWLEAGVRVGGGGPVCWIDQLQHAHAEDQALANPSVADEETTHDHLRENPSQCGEPVRLLLLDGAWKPTLATTAFSVWGERVSSGGLAVFPGTGANMEMEEMLGKAVETGRWKMVASELGLRVLQKLPG